MSTTVGPILTDRGVSGERLLCVDCRSTKRLSLQREEGRTGWRMNGHYTNMHLVWSLKVPGGEWSLLDEGLKNIID